MTKEELLDFIEDQINYIDSWKAHKDMLEEQWIVREYFDNDEEFEKAIEKWIIEAENDPDNDWNLWYIRWQEEVLNTLKLKLKNK